MMKDGENDGGGSGGCGRHGLCGKEMRGGGGGGGGNGGGGGGGGGDGVFAGEVAGLLISAPRSGAGKTTVALGMMRAFC